MLVDEQDQKSLHDKLELCIDPLDPDQHSDGLVNIVTGQVVSHPSVNVEKAVQLGKTQMETFKQSWPYEFHDAIPKSVTTMVYPRKHIKVGDTKVFDTETIYARAMSVQSSAHDDIQSNMLISYELSPVQFDENTNM